MKPALFLDRDGVINVEKNYVHRIEDFEFVDGIFELCKIAQDMGYAIVVVTNQAGIGRGYYTEADFRDLTDWMKEQFRRRNICIAGVYHCPYHPTGGVGDYRRESYDRKPNPGMLFRAQQDLGLDLKNSVLVGDKISDMEAGRAAGIARLVFMTHDPDEHGLTGCIVFPSLVNVAEWLGSAAKFDCVGHEATLSLQDTRQLCGRH